MKKVGYVIASIMMWVVYAMASPDAGTSAQRHDPMVSKGWCHGVNSSKYLVCHSNSEINKKEHYIKKIMIGNMPPCSNIFPFPPGPYRHKPNTVCIPM